MIDIIGAYLLLASGIVANKYVLRSIAPDLLVGLRMAVSGIFLMGLSIRTSPRLRWNHIRADLSTIMVMSLGATLLPALLKAYALSMMVASKQTLLGSIDPFITAVYAYIIWDERMTRRKLLGMLIGCIGIGISVTDTIPTEQLTIISLPEVAVLIAIALGRYGWILVQILLKKERYKPTEITSIGMLSSGILSLILYIIRHGAQIPPLPDNLPFINALLYTTIVGNICGYTAYSYCLQRHNATLISMTGLLVPLFVAALSAALGLETLSIRFFIALSLVALGMALFYSDTSGRNKK